MRVSAVSRSVSSFALIGDPQKLPALDRFAFGSNEYPDRSTTLILQVESLSDGPEVELRGPGIDGGLGHAKNDRGGFILGNSIRPCLVHLRGDQLVDESGQRELGQINLVGARQGQQAL